MLCCGSVELSLLRRGLSKGHIVMACFSVNGLGISIVNLVPYATLSILDVVE